MKVEFHDNGRIVLDSDDPTNLADFANNAIKLLSGLGVSFKTTSPATPVQADDERTGGTSAAPPDDERTGGTSAAPPDPLTTEEI